MCPAPLVGVSGTATIRLQDFGGQAEYLIMGGFDNSSATFATGQIRESAPGMELMIYNPELNLIQVVGVLPQGSDKTLTAVLDAAYISLPVSRTVLRIDGIGLE